MTLAAVLVLLSGCGSSEPPAPHVDAGLDAAAEPDATAGHDAGPSGPRPRVDGLFDEWEGVEPSPCEGLQVRWYSHDGVAPVDGNGPWASHVKYASVDGQVVIFGTTNMDTASWNFSHELDWAIDDASVTTATDAQLFEPDWARAIPADGC